MRMTTWHLPPFLAGTMRSWFHPYSCRNLWDIGATIIGGHGPLRSLKNSRSDDFCSSPGPRISHCERSSKRHHFVETIVGQSTTCLRAMEFAGRQAEYCGSSVDSTGIGPNIVPSSSPSQTTSLTRVYQSVKFNQPSRNRSSEAFPFTSPESLQYGNVTHLARANR
jgi:hypothetical protein